ncbi:MAG TPA: hypothetical protein VFB96_07180 [Pirellulaceae bacterium]|nr:hypothetical protein [Pirellulaceae bacterium]
MIRRWADAYYANNGKRPTAKSGPVAGTAGETWLAIDKALLAGRRGLRGRSSLARLLNEKRPRWRQPQFPDKYRSS